MPADRHDPIEKPMPGHRKDGTRNRAKGNHMYLSRRAVSRVR